VDVLFVVVDDIMAAPVLVPVIKAAPVPLYVSKFVAKHCIETAIFMVWFPVKTKEPPATAGPEASFLNSLTVIVWSIVTVNPLGLTTLVDDGRIPPSQIAGFDQFPEATAYLDIIKCFYQL
jgi:hypothetical protein